MIAVYRTKSKYKQQKLEKSKAYQLQKMIVCYGLIL